MLMIQRVWIVATILSELEQTWTVVTVTREQAGVVEHPRGAQKGEAQGGREAPVTSSIAGCL
jgi:hypothetical protein